MIFPYIIQSSSKSLTLESTFLQILLTYTINSSGYKTLPCGTPEVTLTSLGSGPPTLTLCVRPTRNSLTQTATLESKQLTIYQLVFYIHRGRRQKRFIITYHLSSLIRNSERNTEWVGDEVSWNDAVHGTDIYIHSIPTRSLRQLEL